MWKWECEYVSENGERCGANALHRVHFAKDHPFNHVDVCREHLKKYTVFAWIQDLGGEWECLT